jgi:hypothetical protein
LERLALLEDLSHHVPEKAVVIGTARVSLLCGLRARLCCPARRILFANQSRVLGIVHDEPLTAERILEQLALRRTNSTDAHPFAQDQALGDN